MSAGKKILVVEDEKDVLTYLVTLLEDNGYETVTAEDGIQGMEMAKKERPDLITLDIAMPNQTGVRTYRQYRDDPELEKIPVVIITAVGDEMRRYFQKVPGFQKPDGFMNKPIDEERLINMVKDILTA
jgi:CheY-like chemotaxis protein